jgi:hypothetical protein
MPVGLNNAPTTYQRGIDVILMGLKGIDCLVYLDDIICFSPTMEEQARKLEEIFKRLEQANFKIQQEKCFLQLTQLNTWDTFALLSEFDRTLRRSRLLSSIRFLKQ